MRHRRASTAAACVVAVSSVAFVVCVRCVNQGPGLPLPHGAVPQESRPVSAGPASRDGEPTAAPAAVREPAPVAAFVAAESHPLDTAPLGHATVLVVDGEGRPVPGASVRFQGDLLPGELRATEAHMDVDGALRWLLANGASTTTDAVGRAVVPRTTSQVRVVATKDGDIGELDFGMHEPTPPGGWRLVILPQRWLRIEVVDGDGLGLAHSPLGYHATRDDLAAGYGTTRIGCTDAMGVLALPADDALLAAAAAGTVVVVLPGTQLASSRWDADALTLQLGLQRGGNLEVAYVDADGRPIPGHWLVEWWARGDSVGERHAYARTDADGCLRLAHVPPGRSFQLDIEQAKGTVEGPRRAGETVRATLQTAADAIVLRGRLLVGGEPLGGANLLAEVGPAPPPGADGQRVTPWPAFGLARHGRQVWTGGEGPPPLPQRDFQHVGTRTTVAGEFAFALRRTPFARDGVAWLLPAPRSPDCRHAVFHVPVDAGATYDVGDLELGDDGLVLTGQLVDEQGRAVTHARVDTGFAGPTTGGVRDVAFLAGDGMFRVYRNVPEPSRRVRVEVEAAGCASAGHSFAPGQRDVRIVMRREPRLRVEAFVDADVLPLAGQLGLALLRGSDPIAGTRAVAHGDRLVAELPLRDGDARLELQLTSTPEPVVTAEVTARDGHVQVHRFDLRGRLAVHAVEVRDVDGMPVWANCRVVLTDPQGETHTNGVGTTVEGIVRVLASRPTTEFVVSANEYETLRLVASRTLTRVVLRKLPELRLSWSGDVGTLQWCDTRGEWHDAAWRSLRAPAFGPLPLRVVVQGRDDSTFVLPLAPLLVTPGMAPDVEIELSPDQRATLQAAAGR